MRLSLKNYRAPITETGKDSKPGENMINEFMHFLTGYVKAEISGEETGRLLSLAAKENIRFFGYKGEKESVKVSLKIKDYKKLLKIKRKLKVKIKRLEKRGVPFLLHPYKKRLGLISGFVFGVIIVIMMSGRVWVLKSEGSLIYKESEVLKYAESFGITLGMKQSDINPHKTANKLLYTLKGVDFVSVNTDGALVNIVIKDSVIKPEIKEGEKGEVRNVIARSDGVIKYIEASDGMVKVKVNEAVKKGDLLITGLWDTYNNWGEKTGKSFSAAARGKVIAEVRKVYSYKTELKYTEFINGKLSERKSLYLFGQSFPLSFPLIENDKYKKELSFSHLYLLGVKMPIGLISEKYREQIPIERELTEFEAQNKLKNMFHSDIRQEIFKGNELLNRKLDYKREGNTLYLTAECVFLEDIAEIVPVLFEEISKEN